LRLFSDEKNRPPLNGFKKGLDVYFVGGFLGKWIVELLPCYLIPFFRFSFLFDDFKYLCPCELNKMETKEFIKNTGATFTPKGLADYLSSRILCYVDKRR
jgi:hypothetical protein